MPRLDVAGLLWPAAGVPGELQQVSERISLGIVGQQDGKVLRRDGVVAPLRLGLRDLLDGRRRDVAEFGGPVEGPLDGDDGPAAVGGGPVGVRIAPLDDVEGLQVGGRKPGRLGPEVDEALDVVPVPVVGAGLAVLLAPGEVFLEDLRGGGANRPRLPAVSAIG